MHAFTVHPQKKAEPTEAPPRRWRRWAAVLLLLLALGGLAWAVRPDPHMARAKELQKQLFSAEAKNLSADERKAKFTEYREQVKQLSADQKWDLSAPMREKQKAERDRYFAMSPKDKQKYLDEQIDRSEKRRKEMEQKAAQGAQGKAGGQPGGAGFGGPGGSKTGGPGGGAAGDQGKGSPPSSAEIEKRRKEFLDRTSPEDRAKMDQFRKEMNDRRRQRGLPVRA